MKMLNKYTGILLALVMFVAGFGITGCTTTSTGKKVIDPDVAKKLSVVMVSAVSGAVIYAYTKDNNSVIYLDAIRVALYEFLESSDLSASALTVKLNSLPIKELKTAEAQLIIAPLLGSYEAFAEQIIRDGYQQDEGMRILVRAVISGLDAGVNGVRQINSAQ